MPGGNRLLLAAVLLTAVNLRAAIAAVNIARLTDMPSMLPFALYLVCTLEGSAIDGYERRDGSVEHLSAQDLKLCMNARGALA